LSILLCFVLVFAAAFTAQAKTEWKMALGEAEGGTQYEMGKKFSELLYFSKIHVILSVIIDKLLLFRKTGKIAGKIIFRLFFNTLVF